MSSVFSGFEFNCSSCGRDRNGYAVNMLPPHTESVRSTRKQFTPSCNSQLPWRWSWISGSKNLPFRLSVRSIRVECHRKKRKPSSLGFRTGFKFDAWRIACTKYRASQTRIRADLGPYKMHPVEEPAVDKSCQTQISFSRTTDTNSTPTCSRNYILNYKSQ